MLSAVEYQQSQDLEWVGGMAWVKPIYSRTRVDQAGFEYVDREVSPEEREIALAVINNWRTSHHFPLNTIQVNLRRRAREHDDDPTVAQRIKRLPSVRHKLERIHGMKLSRMQDIGGCRAVLADVEAVNDLVSYYEQGSRIKHNLVRKDPYIAEPKASGYRGVHLVYTYFSDKNSGWNGLRIEMQLRSRLQHGWATAVETVGTFTRQALKSSLGQGEWLEFFALMSSALALRENTPLVPGTPHDPDELKRELRRYVNRLDVINRLQAYRAALHVVGEIIEEAKGMTFILELDVGSSTLTASAFDNPVEAADAYTAIERAIEGQLGKDAVMVAVESVANLRRAYPNYFADTAAFVQSVEEAIE
jgi:hypothetical protein